MMVCSFSFFLRLLLFSLSFSCIWKYVIKRRRFQYHCACFGMSNRNHPETWNDTWRNHRVCSNWWRKWDIGLPRPSASTSAVATSFWSWWVLNVELMIVFFFQVVPWCVSARSTVGALAQTSNHASYIWNIINNWNNEI